MRLPSHGTSGVWYENRPEFEVGMRDDVRDAWVSRVLGLDVRASGGEKPGEAAAAAFADLVERLRTVREDLALHGLAEQLTGQLRAAIGAVQARAPRAEDLLDALEQEIAASVKAKRTGEAERTIADSAVSKRAGVVGFAKARLRLNAARSACTTASSNLEMACSALLETPDFADDPRSSDPATLAVVSTIGSRVPPIDVVADEVEDAIDNMVSATDPGALQKLAEAALQAISRYRSEIDAEPLLTEMEQTDAGSFAIHGAIISALDELAASLRAA